MMRLRHVLILFVLAATPASAQNNFSTPGGANAVGTVQMCLNSAGEAVAISSGQCANSADQTAPTSVSATNPTSTLTLPSTTTAYSAGSLVCTSATVATCNTALQSQSFAISTSAGAAIISRLRLTTSDATATAWGAQTLQVDLWSAAPQFATTGDRGSFATDFSTGTAKHLAAFTCVMSPELGDGAYSECTVSPGNFALPKLATGTAIYWTLQAVTGSGVTGASKVFTLTAELMN